MYALTLLSNVLQMWDKHYLEHDPIHDLSLEIEGPCTYDGHNFANRQWDFVETSQETFWGSIGDKMPDLLPQVAPTRVIVSEWPKGVADQHAPYFRSQYVKELAEPVDDAIPIITVGRHANLVKVRTRMVNPTPLYLGHLIILFAKPSHCIINLMPLWDVLCI